MLPEVLLLIASLATWAVKVLYRWRIWKDRGLLVTGITIIAAGCLWTDIAAVGYELLAQCGQIPGAAVLVPALSLIIGLAGLHPVLFALFFGLVQHDTRLSLLITLPMLLGNMPYVVIYALTLPPSEKR